MKELRSCESTMLCGEERVLKPGEKLEEKREWDNSICIYTFTGEFSDNYFKAEPKGAEQSFTAYNSKDEETTKDADDGVWYFEPEDVDKDSTLVLIQLNGIDYTLEMSDEPINDSNGSKVVLWIILGILFVIIVAIVAYCIVKKQK